MTSATVSARSRSHHVLVVALCFAAVFISYIDRTNISVAAIAMQKDFGWTESTKGFVLSSFFIGYLLLMLVSGALANKYGGKLVLGVAVVWWSIFTMLTPPAAAVSLGALVGARIALGIGEAAVFPASINMVGRWVPAAKRSQAVATFSSGLSLGTMVSLPITGYLVREYGWPLPFYLFGAVGLVWAVAWFGRIQGGRSSELEPEAHAAERTIPWGRILTRPAVWAIVVNHFANNWMLYVLLAWLPSYFKATFNISIASAGLLSAAPWLVHFLAANFAGATADRMLREGKSPTFVRRLMQTVALLGSAAFLWLLRDANTPTMALLIMCGATGASAFCLAGFGPNSFDIAPRYADVIWGLSNTFATLPGIIGVWVTGRLVDLTGGYTAPFILTSAICLVGAVVFLIFGSGERQIE